MNEFQLIEKFFKQPKKNAILGIGDDAAIIPKNKKDCLLLSVDTLSIDSHFTKQSDPYYLGWKALAVNISDIVAMGGVPTFALLSLTVEDINKKWLSKFSQGIKACAKKYNVELIGGDTNRGSMSVSVTIIGDSPRKNVLTRSAANINDDIWISDEIGYAHLGFALSKHGPTMSNCLKKRALQAFLKPEPPMNFILDNKKYMHAAIDISDGLVSELEHISVEQKLGAKIDVDSIPMHKWFKEHNNQELALTGGEDYQILFTANKKNRNKINNSLKKNKLKGGVIGTITNSKKVEFEHKGKLVNYKKGGFKHFG